jgi:Domain of unknown function DUF11/IPT/TIG domain
MRNVYHGPIHLVRPSETVLDRCEGGRQAPFLTVGRLNWTRWAFGAAIAVAVVLVTASSSRGTGPQYTVTDLGPGMAFGMNDAGHVVYWNQATGHSYLWVNGSTTDMGAFVANALNANDVVVGTQGSNAVEWTAAGGITTLQALPGTQYGAAANAINASGEITGTDTLDVGVAHAVLWTSATAAPTDLDGAVADTCESSAGHGINASGAIAGEARYSTVANCSLGSVIAPFVLGASTAALGDPGARGAALAINDGGDVAGYVYVGSVQHAFVDSGGTLHDISAATGVMNAQSMATNNAGDVVVFGGTPANGWLYSGGTMTNLGNWVFNSVPTGINNAGQIVLRALGSGAHSYLLTPLNPDADLAASLSHTPEPATIDSGTDKAHVVWTARLTNNGPGDATGAHLAVTLPSGFALSTGGLDSKCTTVAAGEFTCTPSGGTLANGAHVDFTIAADASSPTSEDATATASSTSPDPSSGNDTAADSTTVNAPAPTFNPSSGHTGTAVTLTGAAFTGATQVNFNGTHATFTVVSDTRIDTAVPAGATSGTIAVVTPAGTWTSALSFTVTGFPPTISGMSPRRGQPGTIVTVTGTHLDIVTSVKVHGVLASFLAVSPTQLQFTVPVGATTGSMSVTNSGGTATSTAAFVVDVPPPTVRSVSPSHAHVGETVTITGSFFLGATAVKVNGTNAPAFTVISNGTITVTVPAGATTGPVSVTTPYGTTRSAVRLVVLPGVAPAPTIVSFTPSSGTLGMRVVIRGTGFSGATAVTFNGVPAAFTVLNDSTISATVPAGAGSGPIAVTTPSGTGTSAGVFSG